MAELLGQWQTAVDANLNAYPGAKLYTYDSVATSTPKATYVDPDLTTPHANPVIANGSGQFPQIFADVGQAFYLVLRTAADVLVNDYEAVEALGSTGSGTFQRDFGAGGRWGVSGDAGVVNMTFGPPSGDDVGGTGRIGGWEDTQGEDLEIDFANVSVTGALSVGSVTASGITNGVPIALARANASAVSSLDIALPSGFDSYTLELRNIIGSIATAQTLRAQFSFDGGATYKSAADDYMWSALYATGSSSTNANNSVVANIIQITAGGGGGLGVGGTDARSEIYTGAGRETRMTTQFVGYTASNNLLSGMGMTGGTTNNKGYGRATHIRLTPTPGTVSFTYVLIGKP